jgi:hypothetical protein
LAFKYPKIYHWLILQLRITGTWSYCSPDHKKSRTQRVLPSNFWPNIAFKSGYETGKCFAQRMLCQLVAARYPDLTLAVTGCIRPHHFDRLKDNDAGGQYDASHPLRHVQALR